MIRISTSRVRARNSDNRKNLRILRLYLDWVGRHLARPGLGSLLPPLDPGSSDALQLCKRGGRVGIGMGIPRDVRAGIALGGHRGLLQSRDQGGTAAVNQRLKSRSGHHRNDFTHQLGTPT